MVEVPRKATLEIISDGEADIVNGARRFKLKGGAAHEIIWAYRHLLSHPETGEMDAAHFLWGLHSGLQHAALISAEETLERLNRRRLDQPEE